MFGRAAHRLKSVRRYSSFGVAFDIDGVLVRGREVLSGAEESVRRLKEARVPFVFMTNGGGDFEHKRKARLENQLRIPAGDIHEDTHMILAHTPMRELAKVHGNERVLVLGCRNERAVAGYYGFDKVVSPQQLAAQHEGLYPFIPRPVVEEDPFRGEPIGAIMIMHDPIDWSLEIQVCCDVLLDRIPGLPHIDRVPVYNSNEDFVFAGAFPHPRHAQGTFLACLQHVYSMHSGTELDVVRFGKPNPVTYRYAERLLMKQQEAMHDTSAPLEKIFMIGDNPSADIQGAVNAGDPWVGVLVKTGVFTGDYEDAKDATYVCENVRVAIDQIFEAMQQRESGNGVGL